MKLPRLVYALPPLWVLAWATCSQAVARASAEAILHYVPQPPLRPPTPPLPPQAPTYM